MTVRIITDSGSDCLQGDHPQLDVLPLSVGFGTTIYQADVDLSRERFYELLVEGDEFPTTGQVNPYAFSRAIARAQEAGEDVVVITLSSKLSGTHQSACTAAAEAGGATEVHVVDTKSVTVGEHILVDYALRLVDGGRTAAEVAAAVEAAVDRVCVVGLLDTLEYLKRGGRISAAAGTVGELLSIKPAITIDDGEVAVLGKARGSKNGRNLLRQQVENAGGIDFSMPVMLGYSGLSDKLLRKYVEDSRSVWEGNIAEDDIPTLMVGATIGTHVGPGAVAVAFFKLP
ncbi:DegV family protein [Collinsella stercoris]|uniref:EDD domain protein, DegV family n=1 Tax=Collinsella stercoris DSM 13279 TaxID=445975 RepID=B6G9T4_9ACTN|nr:DegV family protein [Collinsella stercoris]EEA90954.1 EDD domain protein, DegV family [Collinsella stercoris DSM 13279]UEA46352.1 DegV family protein [Collinsella stercoris DSM 13279]UWP11130.1 DegV family protein [Collinsella stercoris]